MRRTAAAVSSAHDDKSRMMARSRRELAKVLRDDWTRRLDAIDRELADATHAWSPAPWTGGDLLADPPVAEVEVWHAVWPDMLSVIRNHREVLQAMEVWREWYSERRWMRGTAIGFGAMAAYNGAMAAAWLAPARVASLARVDVAVFASALGKLPPEVFEAATKHLRHCLTSKKVIRAIEKESTDNAAAALLGMLAGSGDSPATVIAKVFGASR